MSSQVDHEAIENSPELKAYYDDQPLFKKNVFWMTFGGSGAYLGLMAAMNMMPLHMQNVKMNAEQISAAISIRSFLAAPILLYIAYLSDNWHWRLGRRLSFVAMATPIMILTIILFPYTTTAIICTVMYVIFMSACNVQADTYPVLMYDVSRQKYWGRVVGINTLFWYITVWLGQIIFMPMVDTRGEAFVYTWCGIALAIGTLIAVVTVKEPPIRGTGCPKLNPIPVIISTLKMGFSTKRGILLVVAFVLVACMNIPNNFTPLQAKANMGLSIGEVGTQLLQYGTILTGVATLFMGYGIDKLGPFRSILIGFMFAIFAAIAGYKPDWFVGFVNSHTGLHLTPVIALAIGYMCTLIANATMYMAALIFATSAVSRQNTAKIYACNAAANNFFQSIVIFASGWLITHVFHEYYGVGYIIGVVLVAIGIPIYYFLDKWRAVDLAKAHQVTNSDSVAIASMKE